MFIVTAGMLRAGSTWLFNAARALLADSQDEVYACWVEEYDPAKAGPARHVLVKTHDPAPQLEQAATFVLTSFRDLRDVAVSFRDMGWAAGPAEVLAAVDHARACHEHWSARSRLDLAYERIVSDPAAALRAVRDALGLQHSDGRLLQVAQWLADLQGPSSGQAYSRETLLHPNHRRDGRAGRWRDDLEAELAREITARHGDWLRAHGYEA